MADNELGKWQLPGWRIEQKYSKKCLIGNWEEEKRGKFVKGTEFENSSNRVDYRPYGADVKPDTKVRLDALTRSEGMGKDYLFRHHGDAHEGNQISWYDVDYNGRTNAELPEKRAWDPHKLCWLPETSDVPAKGQGTRFGLADKLRAKWKDEAEAFGSVTKSSYPVHDKSAFTTKRAATSKHLSSHFTPQGINKDLALRGGPIIPPRPEHPANLKVPGTYLLPQFTNATMDQIRTRNVVAGQVKESQEMPQVVS